MVNYLSVFFFHVLNIEFGETKADPDRSIETFKCNIIGCDYETKKIASHTWSVLIGLDRTWSVLSGQTQSLKRETTG